MNDEQSDHFHFPLALSLTEQIGNQFSSTYARPRQRLLRRSPSVMLSFRQANDKANITRSRPVVSVSRRLTNDNNAVFLFDEKISPWNKDAGSKAARQWIKTLASFAFLPTIGRFIPLTPVEFESKTTDVDCKGDFFCCFLFQSLDLQQPDLRVASFTNRSLSEAIGIRLSLLFFVSFSAFF